MKTKSTSVKKPNLLIKGTNRFAFDQKGHPKKDKSNPLFVRKEKGKFIQVDKEPQVKPFFTFHCQAQVDDFIKINTKGYVFPQPVKKDKR